jgi:hypothetical protein
MVRHCLTIPAAIVLLLLMPGCGKKYDTGIYRTGRSWDFYAYFFDAQNHVTDSCSLQLKIGNGGILSSITGQRELKYTYGKCCGKDGITETTGVDERADFVFIHPPRLASFSFTEIPPMPEVRLPVDMTGTSTSELKVVKADFKGLDGKTIRQKSRPAGMEDFRFADTTIKCVVLEGENTNYLDELGLYKGAHLFNGHFGFVQLNYYKPNGESVKIILKATNFR